MIDRLLLLPYYLTLKIRHGLYNSGIKKVRKAEVPTISIGNITVGGTGKTPHTELVLRTLLEDEYWNQKNLAVLSRGYKRTLKGFQQVTTDGTADDFGDEPMQIKSKFPYVTVAVDKNRVRGCGFLCKPETLSDSRTGRKCLHKDIPAADAIILDDAFQYRALRADISIVLVDYNRPVFKDHLMPLGRLRDLPERLREANIIIVTKAPSYMEVDEKLEWAGDLGFKSYDPVNCIATDKKGRRQYLFFTNIRYCQMEPVFPDGENRYIYSKRLVLFTGIANDNPLVRYLSGSYSIIRHIVFPDHHKYSNSDIKGICNVAEANPTAVVATTEKDSQRVSDVRRTPDTLKKRLFKVPIKVGFLSRDEERLFKAVLKALINNCNS